MCVSGWCFPCQREDWIECRRRMRELKYSPYRGLRQVLGACPGRVCGWCGPAHPPRRGGGCGFLMASWTPHSANKRLSGASWRPLGPLPPPPRRPGCRLGICMCVVPHAKVGRPPASITALNLGSMPWLLCRHLCHAGTCTAVFISGSSGAGVGVSTTHRCWQMCGAG